MAFPRYSLPTGCRWKLSDRTTGFLQLTRRCSEKKLSRSLGSPPVEFQWHLWHFLVVCCPTVSFGFHPRGISCGHKFLVRARGRVTHQFHKFVDEYGGGSKEPGYWSSTSALRASSIFGDFYVYPAVTCSVMRLLRNTQSRSWNVTTAYKTDVCILPKLLDEKVVSLHLPVLGAALTALTQQRTVSLVSD